MTEVPPGVRQFADASAAVASMPAVPQGDPYQAPDLAALAKLHAGAFALSVPAGYLHESDTPHDVVHAVFVQPKRVTVVYRLVDEYHAIPNRCGAPTASAVTDVALVNAHIGHVRVRRADVDDAPTLTTVLTPHDAQPCDGITPYRIEDHFISLDTGQHLAAYAQVYRAHSYKTEAAPIIPFDRLTVGSGGVEIAGPECHYFWNE